MTVETTTKLDQRLKITEIQTLLNGRSKSQSDLIILEFVALTIC